MTRRTYPKTANTIKVEGETPSTTIDISERHKQFCKEYIYDWNPRRSYMIAYPNSTKESAWVLSSNLLKNIKVQAYIEELQKQTEKLAGISRLRIVKEYEKLAFTSIGHLHNTWIERKEFEDLTEDQKSCISEIMTRVVSGRVEEIKVKLYDRKQALDSLVKFFGYAEPDKVINTGRMEHVIKVEELKTNELSNPAQQLLLEVAQKQLTNGVSSN